MNIVKMYDELRESEVFFDLDKVIAITEDQDEAKVFNSRIMLPNDIEMYSKLRPEEMVQFLQKQVRPRNRNK